MGVYTFLRRDTNGKYTWVNERNEYLFADDKGNWLVGTSKLISMKIIQIKINHNGFCSSPKFLFEILQIGKDHSERRGWISHDKCREYCPANCAQSWKYWDDTKGSDNQTKGWTSDPALTLSCTGR